MSKKAIIVAFALGLHSPYADAAGAQVWLAGVDPIVHTTFDTDTSPDYLDLFQPSAPWQKASQSVQVFKTSTRFLANASDDLLSRMIADLRHRNIALGMEALMLTASAKCGAGIEGYSSPRAIEMVASRVERLGGDLRYVAMDEPLDFGHYSHQPNACQSSLADLASDVAGKVRAIRRIFPEAQIGDIEVIGHPESSDDVNGLMEWARAYQSAVGSPLSFLHVDVLWAGPWQQQIKQLSARLHTAGIKFGIIYNGDPDDPNGLAWTRHAEQRFASIEADPRFIPDQAILQSWMRYPDHMLPETQPGSMTWLVNRYHTAETRLVLQRVGDRLQGQITDSGGHPIGGAPVLLSAEFPSDAGAPILHLRSGQVPPKAASALLALRINTECACSGPAEVALGAARYHDNLSGQAVEEAFRSPSVSGGPTGSARFQVQPKQPITQNTQRFPVTPDHPFTIQVPMRTDLASAKSGYVALIFLDAQGKEIERTRLPFEPVEEPIGKPITDAQGRFLLVPNPNTLRSSVGFHAEFPGDAQHRTASMTLR